MERYQHTWFWPTSVLYPALTASTVHSVHWPLAPWLGVRLVWQWPEPALDTEQDLLFGITALVGITDPSAPSCWSRCSLIYFWADGWGRWDGSTYAGRGASEYSSTGGVHQQELICWCESGLGAKSQASVDTWWEEWGWLHRVSPKGLECGPDQNWEKSAKWSPGPPQKPHCYYTHVKRGPGPHHSRLLMLVDLCCWCLCKFSGCGTSKKMNVPVGEVALELAAVDTGAMCPGRPGWGLWWICLVPVMCPVDWLCDCWYLYADLCL